MLRTRLLWLLFAFGLQTAACGSAPSQPRAEQARVEQSAVLPLPSSSSATHDEGAPPTAVEIVSAPGCTIEARTIVSDYPGAKRTEAAPLRIRLKREGISGVGEPAVLTLSASKAAFAMAVGSDAAVGVTAEARGVNLAGFVAPSEVPLYVRKSHKLAGGLFTATNQTPIQLVAVQAGGLRVKVAMSDLIELVDSLDEVIPCDDLQASPFTGNLFAAEGKAVSLDARKGIPLRTSPDDAVRATLRVPKAPVDIPVEAVRLASKGTFTLVEIHSPELWINAWVPSALVRKPPSPAYGVIGALSGRGSPLARHKWPEPTDGFRCKASLELAVPERVGETKKLVWVGTVQAQTLLNVDDDHRDFPTGTSWRALRLRGLYANVPILARADAVTACLDGR